MGEQDRGLVSVIMPNYNNARFLPHTVGSVLAQSYANLELLVCDDSSTDDSRPVLEKLAREDSRVKVLSNRSRKGVAGARNTALAEARGAFIAFLDSDDFWEKDKLSRQLEWMATHSSDFSFTWYTIVDEDGVPIGMRKIQVSQLTYGEMLKENQIGCSTVVTQAKLFEGLRIDERDLYGDFSLWLSLLKRTTHADCIPEPLTCYRFIPGSLSANKIRAARYFYFILKEIERLPFFSRLYYFSIYIFRGVAFKAWKNFQFRFLRGKKKPA